MDDVIDLKDRKKARGKPGSSLRDAMTGADLGAIADKMEQARATASTICSDIKFAAGILEAFASGCDDRMATDSEAWLQTEYLGRQFLRHAEELEKAIEGIEFGVMALHRVAKGSSPPEPTEGGAA